MLKISLFEEIVEECEGCVFSGPRIVGGDNIIICYRHPYPKTKWWYTNKCEYYMKEGYDHNPNVFNHE